MATYFAPLASGLGDVIVSLPLLCALIKRDKTFLVARCPRQEGLTGAISGLAGTVREVDLNHHLRPGDSYINIREHPIQTELVWGSVEFDGRYKGFRVNDILTVIARDFGIAAHFDKPIPLRFDHKEEGLGKIVFVPGTMAFSKTWSAQKWLALYAMLVERGPNVLMVGQPDRSEVVRELVSCGLPWFPTPEIQDAIDIVSSAAAVVSVDTGLMHVAVQQGVPTVTLFQGYAVYYRPYPACIPIFSPMCASSCLDFQANLQPNATTEYKEWSFGINHFNDCQVSETERCINQIAPALVLQKVLRCLDEAGSRSRVTVSAVN
jgi:hypothetical protein